MSLSSGGEGPIGVLGGQRPSQHNTVRYIVMCFLMNSVIDFQMHWEKQAHTLLIQGKDVIRIINITVSEKFSFRSVMLVSEKEPTSAA